MDLALDGQLDKQLDCLDGDLIAAIFPCICEENDNQ